MLSKYVTIYAIPYSLYQPLSSYQGQCIDPSLLAEKSRQPFDDDNHTFGVSVIPIDKLKTLRHVDSQDIDGVQPGDDSSIDTPLRAHFDDSSEDEDEPDSLEVEDIHRHLWIAGDIKYM
jgi:hypothetical protein